jgi:glutamine amidotransferase
MIAIIDYRMNNLRSVQKAFERTGTNAVVSGNPDELRKADKLVLPGVGAFGKSMETIRAAGFDRIIIDHVAAGKPLLGICLGMQLLFTRSEEIGIHEGLNILRGSVVRFPQTVKVPHIGWNEIRKNRPSPIMTEVRDSAYVYFVHSYYAVPADDIVVASTDYGVEFPSIVQYKNIFGIQFHPEKSQATGLTILRNFALSSLS